MPPVCGPQGPELFLFQARGLTCGFFLSPLGPSLEVSELCPPGNRGWEQNGASVS